MIMASYRFNVNAQRYFQPIQQSATEPPVEQGFVSQK
jgi:hypothetical protein